MTKFLPHLAFLVGILVFCPEISGQNTDTVITKEIREINVVAGKEKNKSALIQALSGREIGLMPVSGSSDVLKLFCGVLIKDYGGVGGLKTVSVRALGSPHTEVDYDGVPVSNAQAGQIDISRFDAGSISEIRLAVSNDGDLLKPAKFFSSGASLSINSFDKNSPENIKTGLKTGSFGLFSADFSVLKKLCENLTVKADGLFLQSDGQYKFRLENLKNITTEKRKNTDVKTKKLELNLFYADSLRNDFNLKIYAYDCARGLPGSVILYYNQAEERLTDRNFFIQTNYKRRILSNLTSRIIAKYNYSASLYYDKNVQYLGGELFQNSYQNEMFLSWINLWQIVAPLSFSVSFDESFNTLKSDITDRKPKRNTILTATNLRYDFSGFVRLTLGLVYTSLSETTYKNLEKFSPCLTAVFTPWKNFDVNFMLKKTFRVPNFNELYYTTLGSTNLKPENASEINLGFGYGKTAWNFSADFYRNMVDDKIVAIPAMYIWKMSNYGKVKIYGADFSASKSFQFLTFSVKYSCQKALDITDKKSKLYKSQIPYTPLHSGSFYAALNYKKYTFSLTSVLSGKRYFMEYNVPENEIKGYADFSAALSRKFVVKGNEFFVKFSCINFTDAQYDVIKFYPMPGRHYELQINFNVLNIFNHNEKV